MPTAPSINKLEVLSVSANFINIAWENLGGGFLYKLERTLVGSPESWSTILDNSNLVSYYDSNLLAETTYKYRITVKQSGYTDSTPFESIDILTFAENAYTLFSKDSVFFYDDYINRKFTLDENHIDFDTDEIEVSLVNEEFEFDKTNDLKSDVEPKFLTLPERMKLHGKVPKSCRGILGLQPYYANDMIFLFERGQTVVRMSNDFGKTWFADQALDRIGTTISNDCCVQVGNELIIVGYSNIFTLDISNPITVDTDIDDLMTVVADLPAGVSAGEIDTLAATDQYFYVTVNNFIYRYDHTVPLTGSPLRAEWNTGQSPFAVTWSSDNQAKARSMFGTADKIFLACPGIFDPITNTWTNGLAQFGTNGLWSLNDESDFTTWLNEAAFGIYSFSIPNTFHLSFDGEKIVTDIEMIPYSAVELEFQTSPNETVYQQIEDTTSTARFTRFISRYNTSTNELSSSREIYSYEAQFIYNRSNDYRIVINDVNKIAIVHPEKNYIQSLTNTSEIFDDGVTTVNADPFLFESVELETTGVVFYKKSSGELVGFYSLPIKETGDINFPWAESDIVIKSILGIGTLSEEAIPEDLQPRDKIPNLEPLVVKLLPQYHIDNEPVFSRFVELYLKYISQNSFENYGELYDLVKNHDVNETEFLDLFENDLMKRNVIATDEKRIELLKFVNNHAKEIYDIKGTEDSYKFMFKLLYNEDVDVKVESDYDFVYEVEFGIKSVNDVPTYGLDKDELDAIVSGYLGNSIQQLVTETDNSSERRARGDIVRVLFKEFRDDPSVPEEFQIPVYTFSVVNIYGDFELDKDYQVVSDDFSIVKNLSNINIVNINLSDEAYLDDDVSFGFPLRVEVSLPTSKYRDDMIKFVHPAGYPFIGVFLLTSFVNGGLNFDHLETIIDFYDTVHWDSGIPDVYPLTIPDLDTSEEYQFNIDGTIVEQNEPNGLGGLAFPASTSPVRPEETIYGVGGATYLSDQMEGSPLTYGLNALQRRKSNSPLWSSSWGRFFDRIHLPNLRLKDNVLVGSPPTATQEKAENTQ